MLQRSYEAVGLWSCSLAGRWVHFSIFTSTLNFLFPVIHLAGWFFSSGATISEQQKLLLFMSSWFNLQIVFVCFYSQKRIMRTYNMQNLLALTLAFFFNSQNLISLLFPLLSTKVGVHVTGIVLCGRSLKMVKPTLQRRSSQAEPRSLCEFCFLPSRFDVLIHHMTTILHLVSSS